MCYRKNQMNKAAWLKPRPFVNNKLLTALGETWIFLNVILRCILVLALFRKKFKGRWFLEQMPVS